MIPTTEDWVDAIMAEGFASGLELDDAASAAYTELLIEGFSDETAWHLTSNAKSEWEERFALKVAP